MAILPKTNVSLNDLHIAAGGTGGTIASLNDPDIRTLLSTPDYFYAGGSLTAPATTNIFDNWQRFSHNGDTNFPASAAEIANTTWVKDSDNVGIRCDFNSTTYIGFVAPSSQAQDYFFMEAEVISAPNPSFVDNDVLSIVVAFLKDTAGTYGTVGREYTISAVRTQNLMTGFGTQFRPGHAWSIIYNYGQTNKTTLKTSADTNKIIVENNDANWASFAPLPGTMIQVIREGNTIRCKSSDPGSTTLKDELVYTLGGVTAKFSGPQQYGFATMSQEAVFDNITIAETEAAAVGFNMGIDGTAGSQTAIGRYRNGTY